MAKVYGDLPKFKKLEAAMRAVPNASRTVLEEIDRLLGSSRTAKEIAFLTSLREQTVLMQNDAREFYGKITAPAD